MENADFKIILVGMEDAAAVDAELAETRGARDQHDLDVAAVGAETCRKSTSVSGVQKPFYSPRPLLRACFLWEPLFSLLLGALMRVRNVTT